MSSVDVGDVPEAIIAFDKALGSKSRVNKIASLHDWAPHNVSLKRRAPRAARDDEYGIAYSILRWPLFTGFSLWVWLLLAVYFLLRLWVITKESIFVWTGRRRMLRERLRSARNHAEWMNWAEVLDAHLGLINWKRDPKSLCYDWRIVNQVSQELAAVPHGPYTTQQDKVDLDRLCLILEGCIKYNFGGIHNPQLFSQCYSGTKNSVTTFNEQLLERLHELSATDESILPRDTKKMLFRSFELNVGKSALCLSGGASFSYRHFGVVKALLDQDLLPNIISGTSGGGLVAALVCTRTGAELKQLLNPSLASRITACWEPFPNWFFRWWRTGARFDAVDWAIRCRWFTLGDLTFREAFERTGKILNISTVPSDSHAPVILLNHITSPDCLIWSALLASAAVPGILNPVVLMMKTKGGSFMPYSFGSRWKDGSLRTDVPLKALNTFFNVNFTIVSQVNPHIRLFAYLPRGQVGRPVSHKFSKSRWRGGFLFSAMENSVKLEIIKCLKLIRNLDLAPRLMDQDWSSVFLQRFDGCVTVWPKIKLRDFWYILLDPTEQQLEEMINAGEKTMYPKIIMIRHFAELERAIQNFRHLTDPTPQNI